ncbi:DUF6588 family protein [Polaribacter butkevichii]|uniref:Uncharacterized protein n=1 Tax=Polaribacter butkevichii TaxID=218490 RepID=A0A2P6C939_9FLAO|nr:DUF6588 family protein [Polaribacter butkevichii]PQJ69448.1 hypothetical protein BTO14_15690 [Polaribacter butkevichii]
MKKGILIFIGVFTLTFNTKAQDGFEEIILGGQEDAKKILEGYFAPAMEGFIYSMNNGWAHTAKVHKVLGFDLTIGASGALVPSSKEIFTATGLTHNTNNDGVYTGPTLMGEGEGNTYTVTKDGETISIQMPGGIAEDLPVSAVPAPTLQLNIGLPYKFEAMVRYFPETDFGDDGGSAKMIGLGLKKEITSWFGPLDKLPLHVSLLASYTTLNVIYGFENTDNEELDIDNGAAEFDLKAFNVQALASLNFPIINVYGGIGYGSGNSDFKMTGTYTYDKGGSNEEELTPPDLKFSAASFKTTLGARLSLGFFKIFADYTLQEYNTVSAGIAFSIR